MKDRAEEVLAIIAALLLLFTGMLDPRVSAGIAVSLLVGFVVYRLVWRRQGRSNKWQS
jgi:hypothetical protein